MQRIETSGFLFKYDLVPQEKQLLKNLLQDRYKTLTGELGAVSRTVLEKQIELECLKHGKKGLSYSTLRRLDGMKSGTFEQETMDAVLTFLDFSSFDDLDLCMQNILGEVQGDKKPLNVISFLWGHTINIEFKNGQKLKLQYISDDKFEVLQSTVDEISKNNRLIVYQLILKQGFQCEIQHRKPHPDFVNMDDSVWVYTEHSDFNSAKYDNPVVHIVFEERNAKFSTAKGNRKNHIKDILIQPDNRPNLLDKLPTNTDALWYCSAGNDFRSAVFFSEGHLGVLFDRHNLVLDQPKLFVFNCLGREVSELKNKLKKGNFVELYNDGSSLITGKNYREYKLNSSKVDFKISPSNFNFASMPELDPDVQAFYFEITVNSANFTQTHPVLYFEMENHNFFQQVVLGNYFNVKYFCATGEGLAFGANKKSMVKHIYQNNNPLYYAQKGFKPELILHDGGQADGALCFAEANCTLNLTPKLVPYFSKEVFPENTFNCRFWGITKLDYPEKIKYEPLTYPKSLTEAEPIEKANQLNSGRKNLLKGISKERYEKVLEKHSEECAAWPNPYI